MTNEECRTALKRIAGYMCARKDLEALTHAMNVLEQEPKVIDKLRAEMKPYTDPKGFIVIGENRFNMILDRCKAETEDT